jgi:hypothetical protein
MKKYFLLIVASMMTISMMAVGTGDGSTKANAIEFDWDKGNVHMAGTKWYHVDLAPLYEEDNPSLTLYVTNPSRDKSVEASMTATVAGETDSKHYTVSPHEHQVYSTNAGVLVRLRQTEIYLTLTTDGEVRLSAKVFETTDLDETCKDAKTLKWDTETTQTKGYAAWWKVDLNSIKDTVNNKGKDARVTITNIGTKAVNLKAGQSLDCPSSGLTKRNYTIPAGESILDTIPQSMIVSVYPDELYFSIENQEAPVKILVEMVDRPKDPIIPEPGKMDAVVLAVNPTDSTIQSTTINAGQTLFAFSVADLNALAKYEPEFTYRNENGTAAHVTTKMAFERPAYGSSNASYTIPAGEEEIVVYKKNMLEGLTAVDSIYLLTIADQPIKFSARFKHVREGKACKTNIDFNWEAGNIQEGRLKTQWYAVDISEAQDNLMDIVFKIQNLTSYDAKLKASLAFSCPYIDLQEISRTLPAGKTFERTIPYSVFGMMSGMVWVGVDSDQDIKISATLKPTQTKEADEACLKAAKFDWENGVRQKADTTVWYKIAMDEAREQAAKFPTVFVQNFGTAIAHISAELSLECPDSIVNQERTTTIAANGTYTKQIARSLFENIVQDTIYLRVTTDQELSIQIRLSEEKEGTSCRSAIPFNWVSGNQQSANANLWYAVDLRDVMKSSDDIRITIENKDKVNACKGVIQLSFTCPDEEVPSIQEFKLAKSGKRSIMMQNASLETLVDSVVYVNLQGTTTLHFWAERIPAEPWDTIYADGIKLDTIKWNTLYTQTTDTAWYIVPKEQMDYVRNLNEKMKPVAHLKNLGAATTIKGEIAYQFPIVKKMMTKSHSLGANKETHDTIPLGTFDQMLKKDSVIVRITRPAGASNFQFKLELVEAFSGKSRYDAMPIILGKKYELDANTEAWYKLKTSDLKKDKSLHGKSLFVAAKNLGNGATDIKTAVYEGLLSEEDMLEGRGHRSFKKGEGKSHNVPAYAVYAVNDVELYIKVSTTQKVMFETKFQDYSVAATPDTLAGKAKLAVPNVDYVIKANEPQWFAFCVPYIRNNFKYSDDAFASFKKLSSNPAKITTKVTFQDTLTYIIPERSRTLNRQADTATFKEAIGRGIKRLGYNYSLEGTQEAYIDSIIRRLVTADSVTAYVYVNSTEDIQVRINMPQTTGSACGDNDAMRFDWEHGNVNPKDQTTWIHVDLEEGRIPEGKDLRLHVENWADEAASATASVYYDCMDPQPAIKISHSLKAQEDKSKDISRDMLVQLGWPTNVKFLKINYNSDQATRVWAELIEATPRDTLRDTIDLYVCLGTDTLGHTISAPTEWADTISDLMDTVKAAMYDSIRVFRAYVLETPKIIAIENIPASDMPAIKRDAVLDLSKATAWLQAEYDKLLPKCERVTSIKWEYSTDGAIYNAIPATNLGAEHINLRYSITTECGGANDTLFMNPVRSVEKPAEPVCNLFKWNDSVYHYSTKDSIVFSFPKMADSTAVLDLNITNPYVDTLKLVAKYGDRLIMINRAQINKLLADSLDLENDTALVSWYFKANATDAWTFKKHGYYICKFDGSQLEKGFYYAEIDIPAAPGKDCGSKGMSLPYEVKGAAAAPALMPSLARPGEDIRVVNLDPEQNTTIRIYTSEGLLQATYNVSGETSFTIKAANAYGFYMVELTNDDLKSTLRYIVK